MRSLDDLEVDGKRVLTRVDFNVPLGTVDGQVTISDDGRIRAALPTIEWLRAHGASVILVAHLGRPKGVPKQELSLAPVAARLGELLGTQVPLIRLEDLGSLTLQAGEVVLVENIRFDSRETSKDAQERRSLARELASNADLFVSEGFGVVHREQASVTEVAQVLPNAAGWLVAREAQVFTRILEHPDRPFVVILGGAKVSDKLGVIGNLIARVDRLLIGGGMAYTFLAAKGYPTGDSIVEPDQVPTVADFLRQAAERGVDVLLPVDLVVADAFAADATVKVVPADQIPDGWQGLDIGPRTREMFAASIAGAGTIVWNGPVGVFEMAPFAAGTRSVAEAVAGCPGFTVIGGGDSAAAVRQLGIPDENFGHISTGGGASLEFLEGRTLPGLSVLETHD
ncbi:MAG: phosphoglycerate kinase [Actinobacteria bacterium]|nr:phosphoglycerate kinase [Actinomycetota bacterium]